MVCDGILYVYPGISCNGDDVLRIKLKKNECSKSGQFFRAYNEIPTLLSLLIVGYVITKSILPIYTFVVIVIFGFIIYKIATLKKNKKVSK